MKDDGPRLWWSGGRVVRGNGMNILRAVGRIFASRTLGHIRSQGDIHTPTAVCCHPVTGRIAVGGDDGQLQVWEAELKQSNSAVPAHTGRVSAMCWHPGLNLIIAGGSDQVVSVLSPGHTKPQARISVAGTGKIVSLNLTSGGQLLPVVTEVLSQVSCVSVMNGQPYAAVGTITGTLHVIDLEANHVVSSVSRELSSVRSIAFADSGRILTVAYSDGAIGVIEPLTWKMTHITGPSHRYDPSLIEETERLLGKDSSVASSPWSTVLSVLPDGATVVSVDSEGRLCQWSVGTLTPVQYSEDLPSDLDDLRLSADGSTMTGVRFGLPIMHWSITPFSIISITPEEFTGQPFDLEPSGDRVIICNPGGVVDSWRIG